MKAKLFLHSQEPTYPQSYLNFYTTDELLQEQLLVYLYLFAHLYIFILLFGLCSLMITYSLFKEEQQYFYNH